MFRTTKEKIILAIYVFLVISIPIGAYLASQQTNTKSRASEDTNRKIEGNLTGSTTTPAQQELKNLLASTPGTTSTTPTSTPTSTPDSGGVTIATGFGPTLSFKLTLEGRPAGNQASEAFVGISKGTTTGSQPNYLLSFTIDLPETGEYADLSLAGLDIGSTYTAFVKPTAQIATSSAFIVSPTKSNLNGGQALNLLTGDLNEDNVINVADYNLAKAAYGLTSASSNWNEVADFNKDGVVNNYDLAYITKNMGQTGSSGPWQSTPPKTGGRPPNIGGQSSSSAFPQVTTNPSGQRGYWLWVPQ